MLLKIQKEKKKTKENKLTALAIGWVVGFQDLSEMPLAKLWEMK